MIKRFGPPPAPVPAMPPVTGLEPPNPPIWTLFTTLEGRFGAGQWHYYFLGQLYLAAYRAGQTMNDELLRQYAFRCGQASGPMAATGDELLVELHGVVTGAIELWRSLVRAAELGRRHDEEGLTAVTDDAKATIARLVDALGRARQLVEARLAGLHPQDPMRLLPSFVTVAQQEMAALVVNIDMVNATAIMKDLPRFLELAASAAATQRRLADEMAALNIPDAGVFEMSQNLMRGADLIEEQAAAMRRLSSSDLEYMPLLGDRVFLIHGHATDYQAARTMLDGLGFAGRVTVLKEEPSRGQTILEKFLRHAGQACVAVALVTPDDVVQTPRTSYGQARPNVLFELGWFIGRFGPERVCILVKAGTPLPSDLAGVLTLEYADSVDEVRDELRRELAAMELVP